MAYQWWVFVHLAGVFGFLAAHGVSMGVALRLRKERDPARIAALLDVSSRSITPFYISLGPLLAGGIVAAFVGDLWSFGWIWAAVATLIVISVVMFLVATPYYRKARFVIGAVAGGSEAVTPQDLDRMLRSPRPVVAMWLGLAGLGFILYLMLFKPTLGLEPASVARLPRLVPDTILELSSTNSRFTPTTLRVLSNLPFGVYFDNRDASIPHNVAVFDDGKRLFTGQTFPGPDQAVYKINGLSPGIYRFVCDVHPTSMSGTLEVGL